MNLVIVLVTFPCCEQKKLKGGILYFGNICRVLSMMVEIQEGVEFSSGLR